MTSFEARIGERYSWHDEMPKASSGTIYPCRQEDLDALTTLPGPNTHDPVPPEKAIRDLVAFNSPSRHDLAQPARSALQRLKDIIYHVRTGHNRQPDVIYKMFPDIDLLFFDGYLKGNVKLRWVTEAYLGQGGPSKYAACTSTLECGERQAFILLNADMILLCLPQDVKDITFGEMWECTLHEMIVSPQLVLLRSCQRY